MNTSLYIARRYLFSPKSHSAINIISIISVCGVALTTMAMLCTLSVFNGFQGMIKQQFTAFDPDLRVETSKGKHINNVSAVISKLKRLEGVEVVSPTIEEQAMVQYAGQQQMVVIKGVDENFRALTQIDSVLYGNGYFGLAVGEQDYCIMGMDLFYSLGLSLGNKDITGLTYTDTLRFFVPRRGERINPANPMSSINEMDIPTNTLVFALGHKKYDGHYALVSMRFAEQLLGYADKATAIGIKVHPSTNAEDVAKAVERKLGDDFKVLNREQQQSEVLHIMKIEKLISFLFLAFILIIASFNVIGSLSMLIIDKQKDIRTLRNMGADNNLISKIFFAEGILTTIIGAVSGLLFGYVLCYMQQQYGIIALGGGDNEAMFSIDAYPVQVVLTDIIIILATVITVGCLSIAYPVYHLRRHLL